jgi:hypothetical protein
MIPLGEMLRGVFVEARFGNRGCIGERRTQFPRTFKPGKQIVPADGEQFVIGAANMVGFACPAAVGGLSFEHAQGFRPISVKIG